MAAVAKEALLFLLKIRVVEFQLKTRNKFSSLFLPLNPTGPVSALPRLRNSSNETEAASPSPTEAVAAQRSTLAFLPAAQLEYSELYDRSRILQLEIGIRLPES